jgi:hypothetical protein
VSGRGGRVVAGGGFQLSSVSWSIKGEGESTGRLFDKGETKRSGQHAFSTTRARWGVTDDGTRRGDTNRGQQQHLASKEEERPPGHPVMGREAGDLGRLWEIEKKTWLGWRRPLGRIEE